MEASLCEAYQRASLETVETEVAMRKQKECVAMLLAGGQGSRLQPLTERLAKPAVPFGGRYRIVDFTLSNCTESGIDTVGVLTQYQPLVLNEYIGNGQPWDLDVNHGGVHILPPYQAKKGGAWYKGTANAVWQNRMFIERYEPRYVLVLSGDHIYRMNYRRMLQLHREREADCTIAVIEVPIREASRFGVLSVDDGDRVTQFAEKPAVPKSNLASMGIYIFNTEYLLRHLLSDDRNKDSQHDFGKDVIPAMLGEGGRLFAYRFGGYWRDVGTLESLWQANMDLLGFPPEFDLFSGESGIWSRSEAAAPQFLGESARIADSLLSEGCHINGSVEHSVISPGVTVEEGAVVKDSVLMSGVHIGAGARVEYAILDEGVTVKEHENVGGSRLAGASLTVMGRESEVL